MLLLTLNEIEELLHCVTIVGGVTNDATLSSSLLGAEMKDCGFVCVGNEEGKKRD